jgi:cysteine desulfurase
MGLDPQLAHGSLRLTLGRDTTETDVDRTLEAVAQIVPRLRAAHEPRPEPVPA